MMFKSRKAQNWLLAIVYIFIATTAFSQNLRISGGNGHSVVICANGNVFAWGKNDVGQLGLQTDNVTPYGGAFSSTPRQVGGLGQIFQIDAGSGSHTLALTCQGKVYAWGANATNQLGNNTDAPGGASAKPVLVKAGVTGAGDLSGVKYVSGGNDESFALLNNGRAVSWGQNDKGQLGDGTLINRAAPVYVLNGITGLPLENIIQIEAGDENGYALTADGTVWSWGEPTDSKALGRVATDPSRAHPVQLQNGNSLTGVKEISAGDRHGLAITTGGQLYSWGGDWGQGQLGQGPAYQDVPYASLVVGGASGEAFLGTTDPVTSIAAGQAHSIATTASGKVYTWGSNGFFLAATPTPAGQLGVGTAGGIATNAVYFTSSTGPNQSPMLALNGAAGFTNAISASDGDAWSFILTGDGKIFVAGYNVEGELGIAGNTTNQYTFTELAIPSCGVITPCPTLDLGPNLNFCLPFTVTLDAGLIYPGFTVNLYKNDVLQPGSVVRPWVLGGGAINVTFPVSSYANEWKIEIVDTRTATQRPCTPCPTAKDSLSILAYPQRFTVPTPLTFCGATLSPYVNGPGKYNWYKDATGGSILSTTFKNGLASIPKASVNPPVAGEYTVYVEEDGEYLGNIAKVTPANCTSITDKDNYNPVNSVFTLTNTPKAVIDTISFYVKNEGNNTYANVQLVIYGTKTQNSHIVADNTQILNTTAAISVTTVGATGYTLVKVPVNYTLAGPAGTSYAIGFKNNSINGFKVANFDCNKVGTTDDIATGGPYLTSTGSESNGNWVNGFGSISNILFHTPKAFCDRVPVKLTEACPCTKPSVVTITTPAAATVTICQGTAQTLSGTTTVTAAALNTNFTYSWIKAGTTPATDVVLQTATIALVANTPRAVPDYVGITGTLAQAGKYILRVEDGNAGTASCFRDDTLTLVITPTTVAGLISTAQTVCTGTAPLALTGTPSTGGVTLRNYKWQSSASATGPWTQVAAYSTTGTGFAPGALTATTYYRRIDSSGVCDGVPTNVIAITVDPAPVAGIISTAQTICSGTTPTALTGTPSTGGVTIKNYKWQSSASATGPWAQVAAYSTSTGFAPGALSATTYYRRVDSSGVCAGVPTNVIAVTVPAALVAGAVAADQTICYNTAPAAFTSTTAASGGNGTTYAYQWQTSTTSAGTYTNISGETNATLTDATLLTADKYYRRQVISGTVTPCNTAYSNIIHITVLPDFVAGSIGGTQTICQGGDPANLTSAGLPTGGRAPYTYTWESSVSPFTTWTTVAGAASATYDPPSGLAATTRYRRVDASGGTCGSLNTAPVTVTVTPTVTPSVTIATPSTTICAGTSVTFTATPVNGGTPPTYQWYKGAVGSGTAIAAATGSTYTTSSVANNDSYYVIMTSTANCPSPATATSTAIVMTVTTVVTPAVNIAAAPAGAICAGTSVTFTATPGNGGSAPTYEWFINGISQGAASSAVGADKFTRSNLANGDKIHVVMVSNSGCVVAPGIATSTDITMVVNPIPAPSVSLSADKSTLCPSETIVYTAVPTAGGSGPTYVWKNNGAVISGQTGATYTTTGTGLGTPNSITVEMVSNALCAPSAAAVSTPVVVTVTPVPALGVTITADKTTICSGNAVVFTATATGTGSTPAPTYEWFIGAAGSETSQGAGSTTANPYSTTSLTTTAALSPQVYSIYVRATSNATCASTTPVKSAAVTVTVNAGVGAGTITTSALTICNNTVPGAITEASPASGGTSPTYTWEESIDNGTWGPANGTISGTGFTPGGAKTGTKVSYRRIVTYTSIPAPCNTAMSNIIDITVNPALVAGVIEKDEQICSGLVPAAMTQVTAPTGGTGTYTYQWQSADLTGPFSNIPGATASGYTSAALMTTKRFQRVETSGGCGSVISNIVTKEIIEKEIVTAQINDPGQVCAIPTAVTFTAATTGGGTLTYAWTLGGQPAGTNSNTYSYMPVSGDNGKKVQVTVSTSIGCNAGPGISNAVTLDIVASALPAVTITGSPLVQCAGLPVKFTVSSTTAGGSNPSYQWFVQNAAGVSTAVAGATNTNFTSLDLNPGDKVYVELSSNLVCALGSNPHKSNVIAVTILPAPAPAINETPVPVCTPDGFPFTATVGSGTPPTTLQWYKDGIAISGATGSGYTAYESGSYSVEETNEACGTISTEVALTVIQRPEANAGSDVTVKEGDEVILNGSGGAVYSWTPDTGLDDVHSSTPKLTADKTITYVLTVTDATGQCSDDDEVTVFVERPIRVPNVITVNGDGVNDTWEIENIESFPNAEFLIYNRWGNLVWKSTGYPKEWDATNFRNGEVLPDGTYFYIIELHSTIYTEAYTGYIQVVK